MARRIARGSFKETDVASAAICDIGATLTLKARITGTTTITSFGTSANKLRFMRFAGALILTHNATTLILPGAANITTADGDTAIATSDPSGNWRVRAYQRANGKAVTPSAFSEVSGKPTTLAGYGITDSQPLHANLTAEAGLAGAADKLAYYTGAGAKALTDVVANARTLLGHTFAQMRTDLSVREIATANRTYYVRTDGSDSNTGLVDSAGGAFLTRQKAIDVAAAVDGGGFALTIQIRNGTYTALMTLKNYTGWVSAVIVGDETTPANVLLSRSGNCIEIDGVSSIWALRGMKLVATGGVAINVQNGGRFTWQNLEFGACTRHIKMIAGCIATSTGAYIISGNAAIHMDLIGARVTLGGFTVTLTGTPAWSVAFLYATTGATLNANSGSGVAFSGAATGVRYTIQSNSVADTNAGGASFLPGNAAGSTATGGQYV